MIQENLLAERARTRPLACPHCRAGEDGFTLGLFWDSREPAWRCLTCGHRSFEQMKKTKAQLMEDRIWDRVLEAYEAEDEPHRDDDEDDLRAA